MVFRNIILFFTLASNPKLLKGMPGPFAELRIVNGSTASPGEFPFMCALLYNGYFTCGGTILSEDWVLTAAHCFNQRDPSQFSCLTGTNDLQDPYGLETPCSQIIIHKNYQNTENQPNDIALCKLSVSLEFDSRTQPVTVSSPATDPANNVNVVVVGWGVNKYGGNPCQYLQKATIQIVSNADCAASYEPYGINILSTHVCAGTAGGGVGQCTGDSGGPLVSAVSPTFQSGIISFSAKPCGRQDFPGVMTRVSKYISWIQNMTGL